MSPAVPLGELSYRLLGLRWLRREPSGRTVLISAMALFLVVILASPLQTYLNRRAAVAASMQQQSSLKAEVADLQRRTAQWNDPAYVERQARSRLQYVRPGDTLYTVLGDGSTSAGAASTRVDAVGAQRLPSWNTMLWSSVLDASKR